MGAVLHSDVLDHFEEDDVCFTTLFSDPGQVVMSLVLKDQGVPGTTAEPSALNAVTITRYQVRYRRADGRNTQGVDVPFEFDGGASVTVRDGAAISTLAITLVRAQAKLEAPLLALRNQGGQVILSTIAEITLYGTDQAGREVSVKAKIDVTFADFGG